MRLGKKYSSERVEAAARRAGMQGACSYKSIKSILERQLDRVPIEDSSSGAAVTHDNIRGAATSIQVNHQRYSEDTMLTQQTVEKLHTLRLRGMAEAFREQENKIPEIHRLSFEERLGLLVDRQWNWKHNQALERRLINARLRGNACVDHINYRASRGLDRQQLRSLTLESAWVREHQNIFLVGATGVGKTYLARALGQKACRDGYKALFIKATQLFRDLAMARADGSVSDLLYRLGRVDVLIVDDFAMTPLSESDRRDFLDLCDERYQTRATVLTSQLPVTAWHAQISQFTVADGVHNP